MERLSLSESDVCYHVVKFGIDIYPQVEIPDERTRLTIFFEEALAQCDDLIGRLVAGEAEFRISKTFRAQQGIRGPSCSVDTFVLTPRGPVFVIPLVLPEKVGETGLEGRYRQEFDKLRDLFFRTVPGHMVMRVGLVRELVFSTAGTDCGNALSDCRTFAGANLAGGQTELTYCSEEFNHTVRVKPVSLRKTTQLPVGTEVDEHAGYGVQVVLDVNNSDVQRALAPTDINDVVDHAIGLWPTELLKYLRKD